MVDKAQYANDEAEARGCLVLLRHGETEWSQSGQYTGRTDLPLVGQGRRQAVEAGLRLAREFPDGFDDGCVFSSPLDRAQQTAALAGFEHARTLESLAEWDYGRAEGRREEEVSRLLGRPWKLWEDGPEAIDRRLGGDREAPLPSGGAVLVRNSDGESLRQVSERAAAVVRRLQPLIEQGQRVLLVAHAHVLRILTTQWLGLEPSAAQLLRMNTAHYGVLGRYRGGNVLKRWNC
ncbi:phosphoglycerate mutase family protein [Bifidobacterium actinocoloniiforme DSM 22766]|uniref:phosphoglycerate mutase (2,3-diphosphoglycerate-dependent) n=1 Tax=Bifidobacterium actinocoloniiforme DSM 22766 TaxID=1437605 RepID=A0A086YYA9_9BIFI|nr:histidine phosphatase family protein [Bifidobacterium actinocoloniiforme]AKV55824.1 histidine phosphatase [Bifidobacterium actinocoloniiforme DSM 22766]KFI39259.1 phosphoglycerate mutase family protein [Bifidobacterium actinocoloniiforme DSM 22766]